MTDPDFLTHIAQKHYSHNDGEMVPLHLLRAWLAVNQFPEDVTEEPLVIALDLDRWAVRIAE